jgi:molecular chaperone DnaK (HSP70)
VAYLKMLVGKGPESGNLQWLKDAHYPHEWTGTEEGTLQVSLGTTGLGDDMNEYTVVELLSMLLTKQREDAEAIAEEAIKDVVITVPPFWAQDERQALLDAAELSKMNVLGLLVRTYLTPNRPLIDP